MFSEGPELDEFFEVGLHFAAKSEGAHSVDGQKVLLISFTAKNRLHIQIPMLQILSTCRHRVKNHTNFVFFSL